MTARKPIGPLVATLILTGLGAGTFLMLAVGGNVFTGTQTAPNRSARGTNVPPARSTPAWDSKSVATTVSVSIDNFAYLPAEVTVTRGTEVTWTNRDDAPHTVTADDKAFNSPALDTDEHFSHVFTSPGEYAYFCGLHPHMTGRVIVK
jgi:plastocyanin